MYWRVEMRIYQIISLKLIIFSLMLVPFTLSIGIVCAETRYVSDELIITMREGQGKQFKIIKMLKAGTPLEIIEEGEEYLKVRIKSGSEGWVLKQFITGETPKPVIIAGLEKEIVPVPGLGDSIAEGLQKVRPGMTVSTEPFRLSDNG